MFIKDDEAAYFFDENTVVKKNGSAIIWTKLVQKRNPLTDGSWATASKMQINCTNRTIQSLGFSSYDKSGKFINSHSLTSRELEVTPGSIGDELIRIICRRDFPKSKAGKDADYTRLENNDIFEMTRKIVDWEDSKQDKAPK